MTRIETMKKILTGLALGLTLTVTGVFAEEAAHNAAEPTHFPILKPVEQSWTFAGPFGYYDLAQLQRGLKVYKEVCSACHSMKLVPFRQLADLGYNEEQIKAFAAEYEVQDGPNDAGDMFTRKAIGADKFPSPFANDAAAAAANNGAAPPDFSLLAKARGVERGFPKFVLDVFTQYAENGPDYIYNLIVGYNHTPPEGMEIPEGTYFNPFFVGGKSLSMAPPIADEQVTYEDGSPQTVDQYARDVATFMMWAAEPSLPARKKLGFSVMIFMALFGSLVYLTKKKVWSHVAH